LETKIRLPTNQCYHTKHNDQPWHDLLGHINEAGVAKLVNSQKGKQNCDICLKGKITALPFSSKFTPALSILENVHLDLCGPIATPTVLGSQYFMIIINQFSKFISIKLLRQKNEAFNQFKEFKNAAENLHSPKIKRIISDGGGEFKNHSFEQLCIESGIEHRFSPACTPQHNGISERGNQSIIEKARCLLIQSALPLKFWGEAVSTAAFLCNLIPKQGDNKTPFKNWYHQKPPLKCLRPFGCKAWIRIPPQLHTHKFAPVSWEGIFLGYKNNGSSYRILRSQDQAVVISRHVFFD
ncbi:hypothetical protein O181_007779, partial [Austropuccinia psidii MF-1]|nr:hypothetical protein [Austropuccinia psidii MF-1]